MAVMRSKDGDELYIDCYCGCNDGYRFKIDRDDFDYYCFMTYTNGTFYREQGDTLWGVLCKKWQKILAIIKNKDYYYSEVNMTKDEFDDFREYINSID